MILCPNCLHKEMVGAYFCSKCGTQLIFPDGVPTSSIRPTSGDFQDAQQERTTVSKTHAPPVSDSGEILSLNIIECGEILPIKGRSEVTLGRVSEGQPIIPDIDLSRYKAYEAGVSRMHASILVGDNEVTIVDLGSANGTRINQRKITSHIPYPINHGDIVTLGKFSIQVLLRLEFSKV